MQSFFSSQLLSFDLIRLFAIALTGQGPRWNESTMGMALARTASRKALRESRSVSLKETLAGSMGTGSYSGPPLGVLAVGSRS